MTCPSTDISYILCIYRAYEIENGLNSIISQRGNESIVREVVIVNDACQDNGVELACQFLDNHSVPYKVVHNEKNCGPSISFNRGARNASGNYLIFVDADDFFPNDVEAKTVELIKREGGDWLFGKTNKIDGYISQEKMAELSALDQLNYRVIEGNILNYILTKARIAATYLMVEKTLFAKSGGFDERCFVQDVPIFLRLAIHSTKLIYCDNYLFYFKRNVDSLSSKLKLVNSDGFLSHYYFLQDYSGKIAETEQKILRKILVSTLMKSFQRMKNHSGNYLQVFFYYILSKIGFDVKEASIVKLRKGMPEDIICSFEVSTITK